MYNCYGSIFDNKTSFEKERGVAANITFTEMSCGIATNSTFNEGLQKEENKITVSPTMDYGCKYKTDVNFEDDSMSELLIEIINGEILVTTDSRSSKYVGEVFFINDDYQKIYYNENMNVCLASVGLNDFAGFSFVELCKYYMDNFIKDATSNFDELLAALLHYVRKTNTRVDLFLCAYVAVNFSFPPTKMKPLVTIFNITPSGVEKNTFETEKIIIGAGNKLANSVISIIKTPSSNETEDHIKFLYDTASKIKSLDNTIEKNSTIGGNIKVFRLSKEKTSSGFIE